jgi:hypothetical protein
VAVFARVTMVVGAATVTIDCVSDRTRAGRSVFWYAARSDGLLASSKDVGQLVIIHDFTFARERRGRSGSIDCYER